MYAIFDNGNKQYKVSVGDTVKVEKLSAEVGATVTFPVVLCADENGVKVGKDVENVTVTAEVVSQGKEKKIIVFKYKAKKNERKKQGHRQPFTAVKITAIGANK
jgi:large subunit ribosomal protein L21